MNHLKSFIFFISALTLGSQSSWAQNTAFSTNFVDHLVEFSKKSSVTGREKQATAYIQSLLPDADIKTDKLGNLVMTIGSGQPKKLITAPLDEPGYVVSQIQPDGYLRINPVGFGHSGNLYHQFLQGHEVAISTASGTVTGVSTVPSAHFEGLRIIPKRMESAFKWQEIFLDVGVSSAAEISVKGIQLLDPVTLNKKISTINNSFIAGPSIKAKAAAMSLAAIANSITKKDIDGTLVIAWSTLELINGKGIEAIINQHGPFDEIHRFNRFLESDKIAEQVLLSNGSEINSTGNYLKVTPRTSFRHPASTIYFEKLPISEVGLPSSYENSPVEMVAFTDIENLIRHWQAVLKINRESSEFPSVKQTLNQPIYDSWSKEHEAVSQLVGQYGVSGDEEKVREQILKNLPVWAKPKIDSVGNIILKFGRGVEEVVFVAHMDETGYAVDDIREDGTLILKNRGGMHQWLWEAQPAMVHAKRQSIQGVFEPRSDYMKAIERASANPLTVFAGFTTKEEAQDAGIIIGLTTVTMPKEMIRLSENRAAARGFDDRLGCAALLMSLNEINPDALNQRVTYIWSVEEETGLIGSSFAAKNLSEATTVYPIDTYVSSDDPYTEETFANCPLGEGAVIRVLESISFMSRENLNRTQILAEKNEIDVQYGMTAGGTDGQAFLGYGVPSIPLSWPGRYSHSPVEIMDYRDMNSLVSLIKAIVKDSD